MDKGVKIKLDFDRTEELDRIYANLLKGWKSDDEHRKLLHAHIEALHLRLKVMVARERANYVIGFTDAEAIAFMQTWKDIPWKPTHWSCILILFILDKMNKRFSNLKQISCKP